VTNKGAQLYKHKKVTLQGTCIVAPPTTTTSTTTAPTTTTTTTLLRLAEPRVHRSGPRSARLIDDTSA
jgi:hypothetical protein